MENPNLIERIEIVLDGRKLYPWAHSLGLSSGVVDSMKKNNLPGGEILALICRVENASFNWLSTGRGAPFYVGKSVTKGEFAERIGVHLEDSAEWQVSLITMNDMPDLTIAIFQMPGEHNYKGKAVPYTIMEVECGRWSPIAAALLRKAENLTCYIITRTQKADIHEFMQVVDGQAGTYRISIWLQKLTPCFPQLVLERQRETHEVRESKPAELDPRRLRDVIRAVKATHQYNSMTDEQFSTVCAAVFRRLPASGEIDPNLVLVAIDSVLLQD